MDLCIYPFLCSGSREVLYWYLLFFYLVYLILSIDNYNLGIVVARRATASKSTLELGIIYLLSDYPISPSTCLHFINNCFLPYLILPGF